MKIGQKSSLAKSIIIILLIITITIGITYAYFSLKLIRNSNDINLSTGNFDLNFINSKYISVINANLIDNNNKATDANTTLFSVTLSNDSNLMSADYYVNLDEIVMSNSLYSKYFHFELVKFNVEKNLTLNNKKECHNVAEVHFWESDENACYTLASQSPESIIASKHFGFCDEEDLINYNAILCTNFKKSNKMRINDNAISLSKNTKNFLGVRIWLEKDPTAIYNNQNGLMENNFSSKISILARKK